MEVGISQQTLRYRCRFWPKNSLVATRPNKKLHPTSLPPKGQKRRFSIRSHVGLNSLFPKSRVVRQMTRDDLLIQTWIQYSPCERGFVILNKSVIS